MVWSSGERSRPETVILWVAEASSVVETILWGEVKDGDWSTWTLSSLRTRHRWEASA